MYIFESVVDDYFNGSSCYIDIKNKRKFIDKFCSNDRIDKWKICFLNIK